MVTEAAGGTRNSVGAKSACYIAFLALNSSDAARVAQAHDLESLLTGEFPVLMRGLNEPSSHTCMGGSYWGGSQGNAANTMGAKSATATATTAQTTPFLHLNMLGHSPKTNVSLCC
ncbi:hypothetical protein FQN54_004782 [Arachnomyces sp. PD_36]|nr:hypothetical protein FQN54_004782 [Arachnomyces sp. PD_36]